MDYTAQKEKIVNPRENANIFSLMLMGYSFPLFRKGYRKDLEVGDLYETMDDYKSSYLGDRLEVMWYIEMKNAYKKRRKPSLRKALIATFGLEYIFYGCVLGLSELFFKVLQSLIVGNLVDFYSPHRQSKSKPEILIYCGLLTLCCLINALLYNQSTLALFNLGLKIKIACCSLVYRKALKLSSSSMKHTTLGQMVNLLSNDVNRFDNFALFGNYMWVGPIQTVLIGYFMYQEVNISAFSGILFILLLIPLHFYLGNKSAIYRLQTAIRTDNRIRLMNEIIKGIDVIKMYTWEKPFTKLVEFARKCEVIPLRKTSFIIAIHSTLNLCMSRFALYLTVLTYVLLTNTIDAKKVYVLTAFYNTLRQTVAIYFALGLAKVAETIVSVDRINEFLLYNEKATYTSEKIRQEINFNAQEKLSYHDKTVIRIHDGVITWSQESKPTLSNVNLKIGRGSLTGIVGPVGSGKTTLLYTILRELPLQSGNIYINGQISYASQEAWIFPGTVRQNILFGLPMDKFRYNVIVRRCALVKDFSLFPHGDKTTVGERGISLSGGQKARINLARAIYRDADIYLLDDPLSAVDTRVGKSLFKDCICDFLKEKTVILVTHQLQYLQNVENIIVLQNGRIDTAGSLSKLQQSGLDFAQLLKPPKNITPKDESDLSVSYSTTSGRRGSSVGSIASIDDYSLGNTREIEEHKGRGTLTGGLIHRYFSSGSFVCVVYSIVFSFLLTQVLVSLVDYFLAYWLNGNQTLNLSFTSQNSSMTYKKYRYLLSKMTFFCIWVYSVLMIVAVTFAFIRSVAFFAMCMRSSMSLHNNMFKNICRATMRFFNTNNSGRILNRFSRDMGIVDDLLPKSMIDAMQLSLNIIGTLIVIGVVDLWLLIPTAIFCVCFNIIRKIYVETSNDVKRLEGVTRSPVFGYFASSVQGLSTIRACGAESILEKEFDRHQDLHSSAFNLYLVTSRTLSMYLDLLCVVYIAMISFSFPLFNNDSLSGKVGLAVTQAVSLTGILRYGIRQSTEMETQMTSVERVIEYSCIEEEPALESSIDKKPPPSWPSNGSITFLNVFLRYFPKDPPVLKKLNFTIKPLEKVGIVGRTGAGKSSLIAALFRLTEIEGTILVDNIDTEKIGLHDLRSKISIIPQEPLLFAESLRKNLDPFDEYSDDLLWQSLEEVELKSCVTEEANGLNMSVLEGGSNFSVGQRQLICLARAILRNNKILVLDEATANVDPQTDEFIQKTIRRKFKSCTVLTIAHRLHTVMDSDKVAVMDAGYLVEFDHPYVLLKNKSGLFYRMVQQTGKAMAANLKDVSEKSYEAHYPVNNLIKL